MEKLTDKQIIDLLNRAGQYASEIMTETQTEARKLGGDAGNDLIYARMISFLSAALIYMAVYSEEEKEVIFGVASQIVHRMLALPAPKGKPV